MNENLNPFLQLRNQLNSLKDNNLKLEKERDELRGELVELKGENAILQKKYQTLKIAKALGKSEDDKKEEYRRFTNMINKITEIEKLLNE
ncbi:MAG: hypothetical protein LBN95_03135 [Prevotellaceae bacterium]|jgi:hypothetical protein|nr:hypothetical protein [Prevotellaceae bacterium]